MGLLYDYHKLLTLGFVKVMNGCDLSRNPFRFITHALIIHLQGFPCAATKTSKQFTVIQGIAAQDFRNT
jgi:hypothetical protein